MGYSHISEMSKEERKKDFDLNMREHIAELRSKLTPLLNCCPQHKMTAEFADHMLVQCEKIFTRESEDDEEGRNNFPQDITSLIAGVANILAFLLHLVPDNHNRRRFMGEVINVVETTIPSMAGSECGVDGVSIKDIEVAPGVTVKGISIDGNAADVGKQVADVISKIMSGEMQNPNGPTFGKMDKSKLH